VSNTAKWVICAICAVVGVIALIYAVLYLAIPIHSLPGFVPGKKATPGHYHKRAFFAAVIGIVLLAVAAYFGNAARTTKSAGTGSTPEPAVGPSPGGAAGGDEGDAVTS
jgi:hypothetical protein